MAGRLKDKVAIVVGAGSSGPGWGNGKCTAVTFAREGARVMCVDRKRAAAEETVGLIAKEGGEAVAFEADSSKNADVKAMVQREILDRFDHRFLNDLLDNPTAELIAADIWKRLEAAGLHLDGLRLWETADCSVEIIGS